VSLRERWQASVNEQAGHAAFSAALSGLPVEEPTVTKIPDEPTPEAAGEMIKQIDPGLEDALDPIYPLAEVKATLKKELKGRNALKAVAQILALYRLGLTARMAGLTNGGLSSGRKLEITMGGLDLPTPGEGRDIREKGKSGEASP
jgi:hypothetical protein